MPFILAMGEHFDKASTLNGHTMKFGIQENQCSRASGASTT